MVDYSAADPFTLPPPPAALAAARLVDTEPWEEVGHRPIKYRRPDGTTFELQQAFSDDPLTKDPETGVPVDRVLHPPAVHFKGKGFYTTDYGTRKRQRDAREDGAGTGANGDGGGTETASKDGAGA